MILLKIHKMIKESPVEIFDGTLDQLKSHELLTLHNRSIVVLATSNPKIRKFFYKHAETFREKYFAFELKRSSTQNSLYIIQSNGNIDEYKIPLSEDYDAITDIEVYNVFRINSLTKAIVFRNLMIDHP